MTRIIRLALPLVLIATAVSGCVAYPAGYGYGGGGGYYSAGYGYGGGYYRPHHHYRPYYGW